MPLPFRRGVPSGLLSRTPILRYSFNNFHGGWRPDKQLSQLAENEMSDVYNLEYMTGGGVRKRGGYTEFTDAVTDLDNIEFFFAPRVYTVDDTGAAAPQPIFRQICFVFNTSDGSIYYEPFGDLALDFAGGTDNNLVDSGHSLGNAGSGSSNYFRIWPINVITWNDDIYMTCLRYNGFSGGSGAGGTWQTQSGGGSPSSPSLPLRYDAQDNTFHRPAVHDLDGDTSGFPRARTAMAYHDRIFAANVHKAGVYRYPSRIYWSNAGTAETWETNSFIEVGADDGTEIVAIIPFGEQIMIFKNSSVWALVGTDEDTFALYPLDKRMGAEGTYCVTAAAGKCWFFDIVTCSVWQYDGANFENIGLPVADHIRHNINFNASSKAVLQIFGDYVWFSYPVADASPTQGDENTETLVWDTKVNAWTRWSFGIVPSVNNRFSDFTVQEPDGVVEGDANPYFVSNASAEDDHIMKGFMGNVSPDADVVWTDNGTNFEFQFRTFWFSPDIGGSRNRLRRVEVNAAEISDQIDIALYRDFLNSVWTSLSFDPLAHSGDILEYHFQQSSADKLGMFNWLMAELSATHSNEVKVNNVSYQVSSRAAPRGDVGGTGYHGA